MTRGVLKRSHARSTLQSVAMAESRARRRLPKPIYDTIVGGSERGITLRDNVDAFDELGFAPRASGHVSVRNLASTVLGQQLALPVLLAPTGVHAIDPGGETAVARAARQAGTGIAVSNFASTRIEEVLAANRQTLFQLAWIGTRREIAARIERVRAAGAVGLIVTHDWSFSHGSDAGSPDIPAHLDWRAMLQFGPQCLRRPRWLLGWARSGRLPDLAVPNVAVGDGAVPTFRQAYADWKLTPPPSWDDVRWLREEWGGPFMLKGVMRVDDAKRAVQAGVSAISVSNHGANSLDGTPASIRALPAIAAAVGGDIEVLLDGGIRRGSDVVKAIALGARAVMIGRAYLWGLAAEGQAGVERVLEILREGIDSTLLALGRTTVHDLVPEDLIVGPEFARALGVA